MQQFKVLRQHLGDRMYFPGEIREADSGDVAHLVRQGVLDKVPSAAAPREKAAPSRKALGAAPENKSK